MDHLKTPHVFLDTTVFNAANFSYTSGALNALADLAAGGRIHVYISDITLREVTSHISKGINESLHAQRDYEGKARILRNSVEKAVVFRFEKLDFEKLNTELIAQLDVFLKKAKVTVLSSAGVNVGEIINAYFEKTPPFGEGKKKAEFPDAFSLAAVKSWAATEKQCIYVITGDGDMQSACDGTVLIAIEKLERFLDIVALEDKRAEFIHATAREKFDEIVDVISKDFEQQGFELCDQDGDVNDVTVDEVELEEIDILSIQDDSSEVELTLRVHFTADVSYDDMDTASYDSEDKQYIVCDVVNKEVKREELVTVSATIRLDPDDTEFFEFDEVAIVGSKTYWIDPVDGWPYK